MYIEDGPGRPSAAQLRRLRSHLPYSLSLYRRLQVAAGTLDRPGQAATGTGPHAHVLFVFEEETGADTDTDAPFAAAYVDLTQVPETAVWLYASDQDGSDADGHSDSRLPPKLVVDRGAQLAEPWGPARRQRCRRLVLALLQRVRRLSHDLAAQKPDAPADALQRVKTSMHDGVRFVLAGGVGGDGSSRGSDAGITPPAITLSYWDAYDKWLFRVADVPRPLDGNSDGDGDSDSASDTALAVPGLPPLRWDVVRLADVPLVQARTHIPRTTASLLAVPSVGVRLGSDDSSSGGVLVAWAFLGTDGSIWTLHCEEAYRGRGLAKRLAARLLRQHNGVFGGDDGWCHADVSALNPQSQAVCRSIGGRRTWSSAWTLINYDSLGDE